MLGLGRQRAGVIESQRVGELGLDGRAAAGPRAAVLQQLAVLVVRVAYGPVSKEASLIISAGSLYQQSGDGAVDIGLTDNRNSLFVQQRVCRTWHDADFTLQCVPTLDRDGIAGIFCSQVLHCNFQSCYIFQFFRFDLYTHIGVAVSNDFFHLAALCFYFFISAVSSGSGIGES